MTATDTKLKQRLNKEIATIFKRTIVDRKFYSSKADLTYSDFLSNRMLMIRMIREGVPYSLFSLIQHSSPFSENDWADFLNISTKSLQRYKQNEKNFKSIQSEKIIEMAEVTHVGVDVFGDLEKFKLWLSTTNFALGNIKPMELLKDSYGKEMVMGELTRINHGILA
jgi:putative toxin-antitoxin system antitoxin component (TIGR02293 family)